MAKSTLPKKFTPTQIECLCALLGWTNCGMGLKVTKDSVKFDNCFRDDVKLKDVNVNYVYQIFPAESDEMADGFRGECYFFKPDLTKKDAVNRCLKVWPDVVGPVLKYVN